MASDSRAEQIKRLQEVARSAEPFPPGHPLLDLYDAELSEEDAARMRATTARAVLEQNGFSADDNEDTPHASS